MVVQPLSFSRRASSAAFEAALCATLSGLLGRAQRKVYLANELAVVRETLPAPGGQREILHGDLEGIFSVSQRGWTMTSLGHSPIRRITRCAVQSGADAEVARVRTRFRRFVLRIHVCVFGAFMRNKLRLGHQRCSCDSVLSPTPPYHVPTHQPVIWLA